MEHQIKISLMAILSLIFMSSISGNSAARSLQPEYYCRERCGPCKVPPDCASQCPFGDPYTCTLGQCYCGIVEQNKEAVALKHCNTSFDCHDQKCMFGFPICFDHVCGCGGQSLYKIPETPQH